VLQTTFPNYSSTVTASASGSFTGTLTGFTANPTGTFRWIKSGGIATLYTTAIISGTSNSTGMTLTGIPAAITPAGTASGLTIPIFEIYDNNITLYGSIQTNSSGIFSFGKAVVSGANVTGAPTNNFTNSGIKGVGLFCITYPLS